MLSALYQKKMVSEQDLEDLDTGGWLWNELVRIQCTKPPDAVARTVELLKEGDQIKQASLLRGQLVWCLL